MARSSVVRPGLTRTKRVYPRHAIFTVQSAPTSAFAMALNHQNRPESMRCSPPPPPCQPVALVDSSPSDGRQRRDRSLALVIVLLAALLGINGLIGPVREVQGRPRTLVAAASPGPGTPGIVVSPISGTPGVPPPSPTPAPIPPPPATPTAFRSPLVDIEPVLWAAAIDPATKQPLAPVSSYRADAPAIYATFHLPNVRRGTTITASWAYNNTPIDGFTSSVTAERDEHDVWIEFHLTRSAAANWPVGTYGIVVNIGGQTAQVAVVEVVLP